MGEVDKFIKDVVENYIGEKSWRIAENANARWSYSGLQNYLAGAINSDYALNEVYTPAIKKAHKEHSLHIHDLDGGGRIFYCLGHSLKVLLNKGFCGVAGKISAKPAKHFDAILGQIVNYIGTLQNEASGAQAFSSFDTYLSPFIRYDKLTYEQVKQALQEFIFSINQSSRWGNQVPFFNITLDLKCPKPMADENVVIAGKPQKETYKEFQKEQDMFNKALVELYIEGDGDGRPFTFPLPTYNITKDFDWDSEIAQKLFFMTGKYGTPTFQNFINSDLEPEDTYSMCMPGSTNIIYKNDKGIIARNEIKNIVQSLQERDVEMEVLVNGEFKKIKNGIKLNYDDDLIEITLENGIKQRFTKDHPCVTDKKEITLAKDLKIGDSIPLRNETYDVELDDLDFGKLIGLYLGDGWINTQETGVCFAFSKHEKHIVDYVKYFAKEKFLCDTYIREYETYYSIIVKSKAFVGFIKEYVNGEDCYTKRINVKCYSKGKLFRTGLIVGMLESDGYIKDKRIEIHIINKELLEDLQSICYTVGQHTRLSEKNNKTGEIRKKSYVLSLKEGEIRYKYTEEKYPDQFHSKIKNIEYKKYNGFVYDFEIDSDEHLFSLANGIITHNCCRLQLDMKFLRKKQGGLFGAQEQTGSIGVVTINLPQLAYKNKGKKESFYKGLGELMDIASESLEIKRKTINNSMEIGLIPYTKQYLGTSQNHFSTIGLLGMNEAVQNFFNDKKIDIKSEEGRKFTLEVLDYMRDKLEELQEKTDNMYNLEATPAEGTSFRFARWDAEHFKDIFTSGSATKPFYTNSTQLPVDSNGDIFDALKHQDEIQAKYTGGTVFHGFIGERINDWRTTRNLVKKIAENFKLPYFTITPTFSICENHGYISGEHPKCPIDNCDGNMEIYSRIVGYYRPVQNWNKGKKQEFKERKEFVVETKEI